VHDALSYAIGGRIDDNSMFGTFTTYRAALGYRLPTLTRLRLSAGSAFKEPRLDQIFSNTPFAVGNPHLRPEQSRSWEAGIEQELARGRATLGATYFHQRFRDLVQYVPEGTPNYFNVGGARVDGVELEARVVPVAPLSVGASYTFLSTEVTDAGADNPPTSPYVTGQPLARRPRRSGSVNVAYRFGGRASASVDVTHVGRRVDFDFAQNTRVEAPAYTITGLAGELTLLRSGTRGSDVTLTARVENLFDARYQAVFGYRSPRRAVLVGARVGAGL
jgi:vitamin B12 transporter